MSEYADVVSIDDWNEAVKTMAALRAENDRLREALEWYAAESDEKFQIVDSKGEAIANFASFTSRARAALSCAPTRGGK